MKLHAKSASEQTLGITKRSAFVSRCVRILIGVIATTFIPHARCQSSDLATKSQTKALMPEYIQEFFLSEAVRSQDKGEVQITFGADSRRRIGANATAQIEYGLTNRLQISLETPYGITASKNAEIPARWSSTSVALQYQIMRSDRPFALSVGMAFEAPIQYNEKWGYEPRVLAAKTFRKVQIHASFFSDVEKQGHSLGYNVASVYPMPHRWFPTMEFNGRRRDSQNAFYLTPGLYRHVNHRLELGLGVPAGLGGIAGPIGIVGKVNWEFGGERTCD